MRLLPQVKYVVQCGQCLIRASRTASPLDEVPNGRGDVVFADVGAVDKQVLDGQQRNLPGEIRLRLKRAPRRGSQRAWLGEMSFITVAAHLFHR